MAIAKTANGKATNDNMNHQSKNDPTSNCHSDANCDCNQQPKDLSRRSFVGIASTIAGLALTPSASGFAGPFTANDHKDHLIPADKKLSKDWIKSLYTRTEPEVFRGKELQFIGMPVGGICCGQLYLGGDGRLWLWDIFDSKYSSDYANADKGYEFPADPAKSDRLLGFAINTKQGDDSQSLTVDSNGFDDIEFVGQYPIGSVTYKKEELPVSIQLEAFSPFIPLNADDSAIPATILNYRVENASNEPVEVELAGWIKNAVCKNARWPGGHVQNRFHTVNGISSLVCEPVIENDNALDREDIVFEDFESEKFENWTAEGDAFRGGPYLRSEMAEYQDLSNLVGERSVNSHNARVAEGVAQADALTGKLTSKSFEIERKFIVFRICGGRHPEQTCMNLIVDGKKVSSVTGHNSNAMRSEYFDVSKYQGAKAQLEILDQGTGGWGNIGIDHIVFTDSPQVVPEELPGFGSMALSLLGEGKCQASCDVKNEQDGNKLLGQIHSNSSDKATQPFGTDLTGAISATKTLQPGESTEFTYLLTWYFPNHYNVTGEMAAVSDIHQLSRHYKTRFGSASDVAGYVARDFERLAGNTRLWNKTWYDSTLPHWLLDRTFISIDCMATQTFHWFDNGRFYGWEGVTCCPGTCQHVWNYAQGLARVFPSIERSLRSEVDYGIAFRANGALDYRAECARQVAIDGQCGTIVRVYREHTTSKDSEFLKGIWPQVKQSIQYMISTDASEDGILEGRQYNTLDQAWYGPMGWISSMYLAALAAGRSMALDMEDANFAQKCEKIIAKGRGRLTSDLFDGEYFIHKSDPKFPNATNTNDGCHIDQVFGQSLCSQLGLPRVVDKEPTESALNSLWRYNFAPDAGGYRNQMQDTIKGGRWYAMEGEAGLVMTTWPKGGADKASGKGGYDFAIGYFNECMTGFEYQVAAHMIYEAEPESELVEKGLAITRAIHDRYHPSRRNPYNEVECGDHYSRAMASFGVFLGLCGFSYHGPKSEITFAPKVSPENFRASFIAAEGWGTFKQSIKNHVHSLELAVHHGQLEIKKLTFALEAKQQAQKVAVVLNDAQLDSTYSQNGNRLTVELKNSTTIQANETLKIVAN